MTCLPTDLDLSALPVHPWAATFPMFDDYRLDDLTESIRRHGMILPVAIGKASLKDGSEPVLCLVDGRNRIEACRRAGVVPHYIVLADDEDCDAYIADVNLDRRSLSKGQRAMIVALRYPEQRTFPGHKSESKTSFVSKSISSARVSQARAVARYCPESVDLVIDGKMGLDAAYEEAARRKAEQQDRDIRIEKLRAEAPDIAVLVADGTLSLAAAEEAASEQRRENERLLRETVRMVDDMDALISRMNGDCALAIAKLYVTKREHFSTPALDACISLWINTLVRLQDALREATEGGAA